jgi:hypothetical protein
LIDRIRHDIQERLEQLVAEAEKLRRALVALDPREKGPRARTAPGATKAKVLGVLSTDGAMTAGDVAKATGLARGTVSTTLTKLAKTGEINKAERGYRLPAPH